MTSDWRSRKRKTAASGRSLSSRSGDESQEARHPGTGIQAILRHTEVGTTQRFYIETVREDVRDAMRPLDRKIHRAALVQQPEHTGLVN